ncbi:hypothetical protein TIFTF001_056476 [Ficus carica]|uniref:Uncharacterized protein n=1 Tax=Ficus carica TaxID=3494 RepID=A0AA88JJP0_FICCA|nr:hypothetical protein TIFTF001_056474 [Ficus carica]GMN75743.1 hypothetical protein TIFTF001_056476 [Ficus carica]
MISQVEHIVFRFRHQFKGILQQEGTIAYRTRTLTGKEVPHLIQW